MALSNIVLLVVMSISLAVPCVANHMVCIYVYMYVYMFVAIQVVTSKPQGMFNRFSYAYSVKFLLQCSLRVYKLFSVNSFSQLQDPFLLQLLHNKSGKFVISFQLIEQISEPLSRTWF